MSMYFFLPLLFSFCLMFPLYFIAIKVQLVDYPSSRKHHQGIVPLIGGLGIFSAMLVAYLVLVSLNRHAELAQPYAYWLGAGCFVCIGCLDDKYTLNVKIRLVMQVLITLWLITGDHLRILTLGHLTSDIPIILPDTVSLAITILAICGALNAFNMIDGVDGLLGIITTITLCAIGVLFFIQQQPDGYAFCLLVIGALLPFLIVNIGWPTGQRWKVFMGDAGALLMGFTIVWLLIAGSQGSTLSEPIFRPVTALWLIALPLMDMAALILRRLQQKRSPFQADRQHLHHLCLRQGWSQRKTVGVLGSLSAGCALIGVFGEQMQLSEPRLFGGFIGLFTVYWGVTTRMSRTQQQSTMHEKNVPSATIVPFPSGYHSLSEQNPANKQSKIVATKK
ncbi:UDP-N-acetylglucosamine--undecaprenyl-phosphate N-acetylglucosaminephosphotransferase [Photobacterium japonica]|uniref:UDP-N-acetylglucosamine--undecaprenyl-phosphate N-acetylglucosaminephosphotransferase n=1 Tax=Photobacterium japonica TaxID=2910235 RepID=UPI003D120663